MLKWIMSSNEKWTTTNRSFFFNSDRASKVILYNITAKGQKMRAIVIDNGKVR